MRQEALVKKMLAVIHESKTDDRRLPFLAAPSNTPA